MNEPIVVPPVEGFDEKRRSSHRPPGKNPGVESRAHDGQPRKSCLRAAHRHHVRDVQLGLTVNVAVPEFCAVAQPVNPLSTRQIKDTATARRLPQNAAAAGIIPLWRA